MALLFKAFLPVLTSIYFQSAAAQQRAELGIEKTSVNPISLKSPIGSYELNFSRSTRFNILSKDSALRLHVVGQGTVPLRLAKDGAYIPDIVKPKAEIRFITDGDGSISAFSWTQHQDELSWRRAPADSAPEKTVSPSAFDGRYLLGGKNPIPMWISENKDGSLRILIYSETPLQFQPKGDNKYVFTKGTLRVELEFTGKKNGKFQQIRQKRSGPLEFTRVGQGDEAYFKTISNSETGFSRTDTLQGMLTPLRTCFDVSFYNLDLTLNPVLRRLSGSNLIRFKVVKSFDRMQIDLFRNMKISNIRWRGQALKFIRELNAVFIEFPEKLSTGTTEEILIAYEGNPQPADVSTSSGGFLWSHDRNGHEWIEVVTQGTGASLWWPCKDHLSDEPDSMQINITLPTGMQNISNGILRNRFEIGDTAVRTEWFVSYPINTYNVTMNIGDYRKLSDKYITGKDTLALNFYYLPYNVAPAKELMEELKRMMDRYESMVGAYPFRRDGVTVLKAPYPLEHQGAVSIGTINSPVYTSKTNMQSLKSMLWHEVGHEWWGNNVSMSDNADIWFHEAFTTYLEILNVERTAGKKEALKKLFSDKPSNTEKMVGEYGVNHFKLNSVYSKGALMVHTLRSVIANDSNFFGLLKGIQQHFALKTINSDSIVNYICNYTQLPLRPFFEQYLRYPAIPKVEINFVKKENGNLLRYRWKTDVESFWMPVRLILPGNKSMVIRATNGWQEKSIDQLSMKQITIDKDFYYIECGN